IVVCPLIMAGSMAAVFVQFEVAGKRLHHGTHRYREKLIENDGAIPLIEVCSWLERELEQWVSSFFAAILFKLQNKRRDQIERLVNFGKFSRQCSHSKIVLGRVQIRPRHDVRVANDIFIERLMHVPEERDKSRHNVSDKENTDLCKDRNRLGVLLLSRRFL